jgi:ubiquinol-cytochrome c reductase cytochrome c subunit
MHFVRYASLAAVAASFVCGGAAMAADAAKGKVAYVKNGCYQCHGFAAQGGAGPKLAPQTIPLEAFANFVRTSNRQMPPYSEQILSNEDLADIHAYVASLPPPPDPKSIPLLNQ